MTDERGGRYFREARFFLAGDKVAAQSHILEARSLMGYMRDSLSMGGPPIQVQRVILQDGTQIKATMMNGQYQAEIVSPHGTGGKSKPKYERSLWFLYPRLSTTGRQKFLPEPPDPLTSVPGAIAPLTTNRSYVSIRAKNPRTFGTYAEDGGLTFEAGSVQYLCDRRNEDGAAVLGLRFLFYRNAVFALTYLGSTAIIVRCVCIVADYLVLSLDPEPYTDPYRFFLVPTSKLDELVQGYSSTYKLQIPMFGSDSGSRLAEMVGLAKPLALDPYFAGALPSDPSLTEPPLSGYGYPDGTARFTCAQFGTNIHHSDMEIVAGDPLLGQPSKMVKQNSRIVSTIPSGVRDTVQASGLNREYVTWTDGRVETSCNTKGGVNNVGTVTHAGGNVRSITYARAGRTGPKTYTYTLPITVKIAAAAGKVSAGPLVATVTDVDRWLYSYTDVQNFSFSGAFLHVSDTGGCPIRVDKGAGTLSLNNEYKVEYNLGLSRTVTFNTGHTYVVDAVVDNKLTSTTVSGSGTWHPDGWNEITGPSTTIHTENRALSRTTISLLVLDTVNSVEVFIEYVYGLPTGQAMHHERVMAELSVLTATLVVKFRGIEHRSVLISREGDSAPVRNVTTSSTGVTSSGSLQDGQATAGATSFDTTRTILVNSPDNGTSYNTYTPAFQGGGTMAPTINGGYMVVGDSLILYSHMTGMRFCKVYTLAKDVLTVSDVGDALGISALTTDAVFESVLYL